MKRRGFTLVELLVVIAILLAVSVMAWAVFRVNSSDKMRSAARTAQSAFLGAKDRALHAKDLRGVRLIRDTTNPNLVTGFVYLQPLPIESTGNITGVTPQPNNVAVIDPAGLTNYTTIQISGTVGQTWLTQDQNGIWPPAQVRVRIPATTGQWYSLARQKSSPPYWIVPDPTLPATYDLFLQTPVVGGPILSGSQSASIDVQLGNDVLPFHQPITLSSGCVIDLNNSGGSVPTLAAIANGGYIDVMFSPRGNVSGPLQGMGPLFFLLRDLKDAAAGFNPFAVGPTGSANPDLNTGDRLVLSVFPQTGLVQIFEVDPTDVLTNGTSAGPPDGLADNPFNFAQQGRSAGR